MSALNRAKRLSKVFLHPHNAVCKAKFLFIFSHMRSRSSVLSHILGSNSGICGYRELHLAYPDRLSLLEMRAVLSEDLQCSLKNKYLLDKILHDYHFSDRIFEIARPKAIFLLRDPEGTIKSIINMGRTTGKEWYENPVKAGEYYCSRLASLEDCFKRAKADCLFIESNDLVDNTEGVLSRLTQWLELDEPLDKNYSMFRNSGKPGHGDSSQNIKSGVLEKTKSHADIELPADVLQKGEASYMRCKEVLSRGV